jgi:MFS superfamily sulfate permease-like transporter
MLSAGYSVEDALTDALAGFTVALCVIPQSIAMAIIAELPPQVWPHYLLFIRLLNIFSLRSFR